MNRYRQVLYGISIAAATIAGWAAGDIGLARLFAEGLF